MASLKDMEFRQLTADMNLLPFRCVDEDLNNFLLEDAKNYLNDMMAVTYLFIDVEKQQIAAYFSLLNDKVAYDPRTKGFWNRKRHTYCKMLKLPKYLAVSIILLLSLSLSQVLTYSLRPHLCTARAGVLV